MKALHIRSLETALSLSEAQKLQEIESNSLDTAQIAMFEMFERENWDQERRTAYILRNYRAAEPRAAE